MYVVREVMQCKPGKVRELVNRFKSLSTVIQKMGFNPFRVYTDVSGGPFWTVVAETDADSLDGFLAMEEKVMGNEEARQIMTGYHDFVQAGRREIYRAER